MEFEKTITVYFDIDDMIEEYTDWNSPKGDLYEFVNDYVAEWEDVDYYSVENWMIEKVVEELKKRLDR